MIITAITLMDFALVLALDNLFFRRRRTFLLSAALGALGFICFIVSMAGSSAQGTPNKTKGGSTYAKASVDTAK